MLNDDKANRKLETGDPSAINELMQNFIMYGENSPYLKRPSKAELKKLEPRVLIDQMSEATKYMASVHYSGKFPSRRVQGILQRQYIWADEAKPPVMPYYTMRKNYNEPVIYFLNRKDARQSHLTFFANGKAFNKDESAYINAFNSYFGGDMSSLVFQEIREFRSLAYTSNFVVRKPTHGAEKLYLQGYIGCQGDKTIDALKAMMELVRNMPEKTDRITAIQSGLKDAAYANRPNFRDLTEAVETWKEMGYEQDPNLLLIPTYGHLNFNDILKYYKENVQPVPLAIGIVGNKKIVDMKELEKYGKVVIINENDIRKK